MIRRLFWLTLGAALGVTGYRRVSALVRSLPLSTASRAGPGARRARLVAAPRPDDGTAQAPARPLAGTLRVRAGTGRTAGRSASVVTRARQMARFAADVREGMRLYMERHPPRTPNTLESQRARPARPAAGAQRAGRPDHAEDGR